MVSLSISQNFQSFYSYSFQRQGGFWDYSWVCQMILLNLAPTMYERLPLGVLYFIWDTSTKREVNLVAAFRNLPTKIPSLPGPPTRSLSYP